jgi:hypothetical protein
MRPRSLNVESPALDRLDAAVLCNGVQIARIVAGDPRTKTIGLVGVGTDIEFSIRPRWPACSRCYSGLDDLEIEIELEPMS